jgi:poly(3-hydroxybutyrate) depolymerase
MSGHYSTLLRSTINSLIIDSEIYVTDWHNARDIPVSEGHFDIEDYTQYLIDYIRFLGPEINVIAICQPAPLALAATAFFAQEDKESQPKSLILMGGPIDPNATPTEITNFANKITLSHLEQTVIQRVGFQYAGVGRQVYPGLLQLMSFMSMNAEKHLKSFSDQIAKVAHGQASEHDRHNNFYDEYLAVMDMTAEFYLSTVDRIFKKREIAHNKFALKGMHLDINTISDVPIMTVEGGKDDIAAPGQCSAAIRLCKNVPPEKKFSHVEIDAGHYGIFAGKNWRSNIRPKVMNFIDNFR